MGHFLKYGLVWFIRFWIGTLFIYIKPSEFSDMYVLRIIYLIYRKFCRFEWKDFIRKIFFFMDLCLKDLGLYRIESLRVVQIKMKIIGWNNFWRSIQICVNRCFNEIFQLTLKNSAKNSAKKGSKIASKIASKMMSKITSEILPKIHTPWEQIY